MKNLLREKMAGFVIKRVLICWVLLSIIDIIWFEKRWHILVGLTIGGVLSVAKYNSYKWVFKKVLSPGFASFNEKASTGGSIMVFALNQIILLPLLFGAYYISQWIFAGVVAGILLVPLVIMINCVTEAFGITKNNFE